MSKRISEPLLVLPALYVIAKAGGSISTETLKLDLISLLKPIGEDAKISDSRGDIKFTQLVRNLNSHKKLQKLGLATKDGDEDWQITDLGKNYLTQYSHFVESVVEQELDYYQAIDVLAQIPDPEDPQALSVYFLEDGLHDTDTDQSIVITEGDQRIVKQRVRERSRKLRQFAIEHYQSDGLILCAACGFDFAAVYGEHGAGFIEIHHTKPIFSYDEEDNQKTLKAALENLAPLCSNCHRMIHRKRERMLTVEELREIIKAAKT
jgi:hypothetical protein